MQLVKRIILQAYRSARAISAIGFCSMTLMRDAAGDYPSCGSMGPSTECLHITISSAAKAMSVPPDIA